MILPGAGRFAAATTRERTGTTPRLSRQSTHTYLDRSVYVATRYASLDWLVSPAAYFPYFARESE
jgi:hypothetical protein